jgi:hypothetical protein
MVLIAAIIIIILLIAWGAYTCYSGPGPVKPTPTPTVAPTPAPTPVVVTPTPGPTPLPIFQYNLGDWVTAAPWLMLVSNAEKATTLYFPGPVNAPAGTSFVIVTLTATNGSSGSVGAAATNFQIVSESGFSFPPMQTPLLFPNAYPYLQINLAPGQIASGRLVYTVPNAVSQLRLQVSTTSGIVQWILPW